MSAGKGRREDGGSGGWWSLELAVPPPVEDLVWSALGASCLGAELKGDGDGAELLIAYFEREHEPFEAWERMVPLLRAEGLDPRVHAPRFSRVGDDRWVESYQATLRPFAVGSRFVVDPSGAGGGPAEQRIRLVPGQAFGTGEHPTTRLSVRALERHVRRDSRWVDLGCGSGILSVVAARSGAARVVAVDHDAVAVSVAREVVQLNGLTDRIEVRHGSHEAAVGSWDGVVANILAEYFLGAADAVAALLEAGGRLIASGFLVEERDAVSRALAGAGFVEVERLDDAGWAALVADRSGRRVE